MNDNMLYVIPATPDDAHICAEFLFQNKEALHTESISPSEWRELLSVDDPDEKHFMICKGEIPVAYMKLNGLEGTDDAWISMLFVSTRYHRKGIGTFAVNRAEEYLLQRGFFSVSIQTTSDNLPARSFYKKLGYAEYCDENLERCYYSKPIKYSAQK